MLTTISRRRFGAVLAALVVAAGVLLPTQVASADEIICDPVTGVCSVHIGNPGTPGTGGGSGPADPVTGITPGPTACSAGGAEIPCSTDAGAWNAARNCYVKAADDQPDPPAGSADTGAWYSCTAANCGAATGGDCYNTTFWSNTPPPGVNTLTPRQAAAQLVRTFQLRGVDIGLAPDPGTAGSKSYVGVPVWMWVNNPQPLTFGPYNETATLGGVTITAEAKVTSILWNMGDGETVACGNAGTAYNTARGLADSPTCGHKYSKTSKGQPGGRYPITATSQWAVTWTGGGESGTIPLTRTSTSSAEIGELQSVNTK